MFVVITENDKSNWKDDTGVLYHFPKRYSSLLVPGTKAVYYKGKIQDKKFSEDRLSDLPHYFAIATIGKVYSDRESKKGDLFAIIDEYQQFSEPVLAKNDNGYLEAIPINRLSNYWRDGVREINAEIYERILGNTSASSVESKLNHNSDAYDDMDELESYEEGNKKSRFVTVYERNPNLRRKAIAIHGLNCKACGFNFGERYGSHADGLIHIHHLKPISELGGPQVVNPESDLIPLCANCHAVVHWKKNETLSLEQLKSLLHKI